METLQCNAIKVNFQIIPMQIWIPFTLLIYV